MSRIIKHGHLVRDRDYIQDSSGRYLKVLGDNHPEEKIVSYVKYFPSAIPNRMINNKGYGYNSFVSKSFVVLGEEQDRICHSDYHGGLITCTPIEKITQVYSCRLKLKEIWQNKDVYQNHRVGKELINFLEEALKVVDINKLGITGSFLIGAETENSDIDLVCYGRDAILKLQKVFYSSDTVIPYVGEQAQKLYKRRMIHMEPMDYDLFVKQETRKLQGLTPVEFVHINCQPLRDDEDDFFDEIKFIEIGEIQCIATIVDDKQSIFAPCYYKIEVEDIIDSLFDDGINFAKKIKSLISYIGTYSCCFNTGDKIFIKGKLVKILSKGKAQYSIEISPWNTSRIFTAKLLH